MKDSSIVSVSKYLDALNSTLKSEKAKIVGELVNLQMYEGRSYMYFSIKDGGDGSTVKCFMWKRDFQISGITLRDGLEIIVTAYPSVYKPNGGLSLQVELVELVGEGALQIAYEDLKKKLALEGLFDTSRKRELPAYPHRIGVITSKSGAVIHDFQTNIGQYGFEILLVDSKVEGQDATKDLLSAITTLRQRELDVLVIMRGGGSLESFLAFNNETLVRAVADFPVPVLTGIGHDKDVSLVALVSDYNVSTPTAVANELNRSWNMALSSVQLAEQKIFSEFESALKDVDYKIVESQTQIERSFGSVLEIFKRAEQTLANSLGRIESVILQIVHSLEMYSKEILRSYEMLMQKMSEKIQKNNDEIIKGFEVMLKQYSDRFEFFGKTLELSSPERQLSHGYSIVKSGGKVIRRRQDVATGDELEIMISDGTINSTVS